MTRKEQNKRLAIIRNALRPNRRYCVTFSAKGPGGHKKLVWTIRGKVVYFPTYEAAWAAMELLPWGGHSLSGFTVYSASVDYGTFRPWSSVKRSV